MNRKELLNVHTPTVYFEVIINEDGAFYLIL